MLPSHASEFPLTAIQNRGIGQAICRLILSKPEIPNLRLIATSRKGGDLGFESDKVLYPKLDISSRDSIKSLADDVDKVDVLINNAGVNLDAQYGPETAKQTLDVNYRGTLNVCVQYVSSQ